MSDICLISLKHSDPLDITTTMSYPQHGGGIVTIHKVLESAYFHISNSGLVVEVEAVEGKPSALHLHFRFNAFGVRTSTTVPIFNRDILVQLIAMSQRTLAYLDSKPDMKLHYEDTLRARYMVAGGKSIEQREGNADLIPAIEPCTPPPQEVVDLVATMKRTFPNSALTAAQVAGYMDVAAKIPSKNPYLDKQCAIKEIDPSHPLKPWVGPAAGEATWNAAHPTNLIVPILKYDHTVGRGVEHIILHVRPQDLDEWRARVGEGELRFVSGRENPLIVVEKSSPVFGCTVQDIRSDPMLADEAEAHYRIDTMLST